MLSDPNMFDVPPPLSKSTDRDEKGGGSGGPNGIQEQSPGTESGGVEAGDHHLLLTVLHNYSDIV